MIQAALERATAARARINDKNNGNKGNNGMQEAKNQEAKKGMSPSSS
jgi:hypothetical protein